MGANGIDGATGSLSPLPTEIISRAAPSEPVGEAARLREAAAANKTAEAKAAAQGNAPNRPEDVKSAVEKIQDFVNTNGASDIQFSLDDDTGRTVTRVIDRETKELIRQIPSEEILALAKALDKLQGLLLKQKA